MMCCVTRTRTRTRVGPGGLIFCNSFSPRPAPHWSAAAVCVFLAALNDSLSLFTQHCVDRQFKYFLFKTEFELK